VLDTVFIANSFALSLRCRRVSPADGCDPAAIRDPSPERERLISPLAGVEISDDKEAEMSKATFEDEVQGHRQRELDRRTSDGIDVRLLWDALTDRVSLALSDERSGESFAFEVDPSEALTAFHHPFAYAT
jgi:hypothetical protein